MKSKFLLLISVAAMAWSCSKDTEAPVQNLSTLSENIKELQIPADFSFETAREIQASVNVQGITNQPLAFTKVSFYTSDPNENGL
jgi:hypothetical protein